MTVYRTGTDSVLMESLLRAAQNGKEVTVVVELMARFDEEANIGWATKLEEVGAHVVYGVVGYKTHAKMLMIVRREGKAQQPAPLRAPGHRQLPPAHRPPLHRLRPADRQRRDRRRRGEVFKQLTGLGRRGR
jgi:polyphosphate kinase